TSTEEREVLVDWNRTAVFYPRGTGVHQLVGGRAAGGPQARAVAGEEESLSYGELNERANRLARWLLASGAGPETRVGIAMERSPAMIVALLGVLKAGAACVPADSVHRRERLVWQLEDAWAGSPVRILLAQARLADALASEGAKVLRLDADGAELAAWDGTEPSLPFQPEAAAYVIYTSGSTGRPKGV